MVKEASSDVAANLRHYEIVVLVHPGQSEQVDAMIERYHSMVTQKGGKIHRVENWGRLQLAYLINKIHKAHYILLNVECDQPTKDDLTYAFERNDAVIRHLILKVDEARTGMSAFMRNKEKELKKEERRAQKAVLEAQEKLAELSDDLDSDAVIE